MPSVKKRAKTRRGAGFAVTQKSGAEKWQMPIESLAEITTAFSAAWQGRAELKASLADRPQTTVEITPQPFPAATIDNLFDSELLREARNELLSLPFVHKHNDLYDFYTTEQDLSVYMRKSKALARVRDSVFSPAFASLLQAWTGIELLPGGPVDLSGQFYEAGGRLDCHDDDIRASGGGHGRRIAFILYLVDEAWTANSGGVLELFAHDAERRQPQFQPAARIVPRFNRLAFFEVTPLSYHRVSEVLAAAGRRVTITGWFHGPLAAPGMLPDATGVNDRSDWMDRGVRHVAQLSLDTVFNSEYLSADAEERIRDVFAEESAIQLADFLRPDVLENVCGELERANVEAWSIRVGPINRRNYECWESLALPAAAARVYAAFTSEKFAEYLRRVTGLVTDANGQYACVRRFLPGHGSLLCDDDRPDGSGGRWASGSLHVSLVLAQAAKPWPQAWGGALTYVARDEGTTLLRLSPSHNVLSLVFCEDATAHFVEYVNHKSAEGGAGLGGRTEFWLEVPAVGASDSESGSGSGSGVEYEG